MKQVPFRKAVVLVAAAGFAAPGMACSPSEAPVCAVTASTKQITATFPIIKPPFVWRWLRAETADNALEYRWEAAFGSCSPSGQFEVGEYSFGVQLFKFPGSIGRSGQLDSLLRQAQHTFVQREASASGNTFRMVPGTSVFSEPGSESVRVTVRGGSEVGRLLERLPRHALLTVNTPDPGMSYTCYAKVDYR